MTDAAELVKLADELPTRLRGLVEDCQSVAVSDALEDAADEIERLRAALAAQQDGADVDQRTLDDMKLAENVRQTAIEECARAAHGLKLGWLNGGASTIYGQGYQTACEHLAAELLKLKSTPEQRSWRSDGKD